MISRDWIKAGTVVYHNRRVVGPSLAKRLGPQAPLGSCSDGKVQEDNEPDIW